jgi:hypothetical protein
MQLHTVNIQSNKLVRSKALVCITTKISISILWIWLALRQWLHRQLAQGSEHEESIFLKDVRKLRCYSRICFVHIHALLQHKTNTKNYVQNKPLQFYILILYVLCIVQKLLFFKTNLKCTRVYIHQTLVKCTRVYTHQTLVNLLHVSARHRCHH